MNSIASTTERAFEEHIEAELLERGGYERGMQERWSKELALDRDTLFEFLQATQPKEWQRLTAIHGAQVETRFLARLVKELDNRGMLDVLRHGITDYGVRFSLAYFAPASNLNEEARRLYDLNRLSVTRQLRFSLKRERDTVDLVLSLNGLPVATLELKNQFTGQTSSDARAQYRETRDPGELLFSFKKRALVHFAVDTDEVWMTTQLKGRETRFLPFNQGNDDGAGNPENSRGHRTAYLWEDILTKDSWLDILANFMHLQREEYNFGGRRASRESLIFPRYHQLDVVRRLQTAVRTTGVGSNYLIQHSAGSGKSNSIAWLAHKLTSLHDANDEVVFDSVIVISDRRVLDKQLQDTIYQFEHKQGVVVKIDKDSAQLAGALAAGTKIIITTLQKFPFVVNKIGELPARKYAVIVDEAHSSQTGEASDKLKQVLAINETGEEQDDGDEESWTYEDEIVRSMEARRAVQRNMNFFAFTATPKPKTLKAFGSTVDAFGRKSPDGKPRAWHLYSMRQAIEEGFILDVLKNYTTYKTFYKLTKQIADDPRLDKRQANRAIARFLRLHPHNIAQKVETIVEHFRRVVMHRIGGRAKAMVVTGSRLEAVRYKQEVDRYLEEKGYTNIKALIAFSGTVRDDYGNELTETGMNNFGERELPDRFAGNDEYRLLLVADKYQTGFDQPLLHTMYIDKKLSGVRAVQTLSRLNRTHPGKDDTFVLDFANEAQEIQAAFQPFYEGTTIEEDVDPNQLYDLKAKLDGFDITRADEIESFAAVFYQPRGGSFLRHHAALNSLVDGAVERFREAPIERQDDFKGLLTTFIRLYSFLSQVMPFTDVELEKFYAYARLLITKLHTVNAPERLQLNDEVALEYYRLQKMSEGAITLARDGDEALRVPADVGTSGEEGGKEALSTIIQVLNAQFGTDFTPSDQLFFEQIERDLTSEPSLAQQGRSNTIENFRYPFNEMFIGKVIERMEQNQEITDRIMNEDRFADMVRELLLQRVYTNLRQESTERDNEI
ncbi:MAG: type restriction enzyme subunit [Acidobacteriota bacterium]|jgi:type I restriction enzyme R subunit|nr:type restriction enzyme subunit [Acidobacteriota bacterium]